MTQTEKEFLKSYVVEDYERPSITADILLMKMKEDFTGLKILLIKRKNHPFKDCWAIPGGFCEIDETLEEAAKRELFEETGLKNVYLEQLYTFSTVDRDPRTRVISTAFIGLVPVSETLTPNAGDDAKDVSWFDIQGIANAEGKLETFLLMNDTCKISYKLDHKSGMVIPTQSDSEIAFDHIDIILATLERLKGKVSYTDVAFKLVDEEFTLFELKRVHEAILMSSLEISNFRRKVGPLVECVSPIKTKRENSIKAAKLYKQKGGY